MGSIRRAIQLALVLGMVAAGTAGAEPDWAVTRDPFDRVVIARYKALLAADPHDVALAKLVAMYKRHRTTALLEQEYAQSSDWAGQVVLGRLHRAAKHDTRALEAWGRALTLRPDDARTWMFVGEVQRSSGKVVEARVAYDKALQSATTPAIAVQVLGILADIASARGDYDGADVYFRELLLLDPKNARTWITRGDTMLAGGKHDVALASYGAAEARLAGDPALRIDVVARRGEAFARLGRYDEAVAELRRAIALAPPSSHVEADLTPRIINVFRRSRTLPVILAHYEAKWPKRMRGTFHWTTLGELYEETGARDQAIAAYEVVVAKASWDLGAQQRLVELLATADREDEAIARLEKLSAMFPRHASFQIELARRYWPGRKRNAIQTLQKLAIRLASDDRVLRTIADLYVSWRRHDLAVVEYEKLLKLDPEYQVLIAQQYAALGKAPRVLEIAKRLAARKDAVLLGAIAEVMLDHAMWKEAKTTFSEALALDPKNAKLFRGRAAAYEGLENWMNAAEDAEQALELTGKDRIARHGTRHIFVRAVVKSGAHQYYLDKWKLAFAGTPPDLDAGYLLAEYHGLRSCFPASDNLDCTEKDLPIILERLVALVPDDLEIRKQLVRAYRGNGEFDRAIATLRALARAFPNQDAEVHERIAEITKDAEKRKRDLAWAIAANVDDPLPDDDFSRQTRSRDALASGWRFGLRLGVGAGLTGDVGRTVVMGANTTIGLASIVSVVARVDWTQRDGLMKDIDAVAVSAGLSARLATSRRALLAFGVAGRTELRLGDDDPMGYAGDLTLDLTSRHTPFGLGLRLEHQIGATASSTATIELAVELR